MCDEGSASVRPSVLQAPFSSPSASSQPSRWHFLSHWTSFSQALQRPIIPVIDLKWFKHLAIWTCWPSDAYQPSKAAQQRGLDLCTLRPAQPQASATSPELVAPELAASARVQPEPRSSPSNPRFDSTFNTAASTCKASTPFI